MLTVMAVRRKELGYSQEFLAEKVGVVQPEISWFERDEVEIINDELRTELAQILALQPGDLQKSYKAWLRHSQSDESLELIEDR